MKLPGRQLGTLFISNMISSSFAFPLQSTHSKSCSTLRSIPSGNNRKAKQTHHTSSSSISVTRRAASQLPLLWLCCVIDQSFATDLAAVVPMASDRRIQPAGSGSGGGTEEAGLGKRLLQVLRAVYHMLRRGLCRKRLMMDLHLLLGRGKLAGRALRAHLAHHPQPHHLAAAAAGASPSALTMYQHDPRDVEFSCDTTPLYAAASPGIVFPFKIGRGRGRSATGKYGGLDAATVAAAFEMMNAQAARGGQTPGANGASPSPMLALSLGRCPAGARQLRVTDSPFPVEPEGVDERVDAEADSFIKRFYEQLRMQQSTTPDNCVRRRG
uniref:Uncharacterized protein n=1 Tax=Avena sativa TaxID=4498 RepID=A0ACD5VNI2_AVESA